MVVDVMQQEDKITGLYFVEEQQRLWVIYTLKDPEPMDNVDYETYIYLLENIKNSARTRYDLHSYLVSKKNNTCTSA